MSKITNLPDPMSNPARAYILCTSPRSGSTLLCRMLTATGVAGHPNSHFHTPSLTRWLEVYGLADTTFPSRRAALQAVLDAGIARGRGETACFGLRMQRGSFPYFMDQLAQLLPDQPSDHARLEAAFGPLSFLHLSREDKLAQAVSRVRAEQSGLWHAHADGRELERTAPPAPPRYDHDAIAAHLAELSRFEEDWRLWFAREGIMPLRLTYESLAQDPQGVLAQVLAHLGRDPAAAEQVAIPTARLADAESADWIARFRAESAGSTPPRS
ncbi:Stf0 family sulfotransferase [Dinoroseobacter sp. S76]|uniref:Stf0 family sulfotransferase n=1 Tax=Dinoroseobacter sp. S76 TaxID=3415124 RepID=UPI003C7E1BF3